MNNNDTNKIEKDTFDFEMLTECLKMYKHTVEKIEKLNTRINSKKKK